MPDGLNAAAVGGRFTRTVHLAYDIFAGDAQQALPDLTLTPTDGHPMPVLLFQDKLDGDSHYFVLNEAYRLNILRALLRATDDVPSLLLEGAGISVATAEERRLLEG